MELMTRNSSGRKGMRSFSSQLVRRPEVHHTSRAPILMSRSGKWKKRSPSEKAARAASRAAKMATTAEKKDYSAWSHENLIERVTQLEAELKNKNSRSVPSLPPVAPSSPFAQSPTQRPHPRRKPQEILEEAPHRTSFRSFEVFYPTNCPQTCIFREKIQCIRAPLRPNHPTPHD
jgi:hypothetical protein